MVSIRRNDWLVDDDDNARLHALSPPYSYPSHTQIPTHLRHGHEPLAVLLVLKQPPVALVLLLRIRIRVVLVLAVIVVVVVVVGRGGRGLLAALGGGAGAVLE